MDTKNINYKEGKPAFNKLLIKIFMPLFYSFSLNRLRVKVKGIRGEIPNRGGILIASHHEDDADPFVIKKAIKRRLNWIAASKIFGRSVLEYRFLKKIIDMVGVISIDIGKPERNNGLFDYITYLLEIGEAVVIFPEGNLRIERRNRKFGNAKKGVIRIAKFAEKKLKTKIPIYPVGLCYHIKKERIVKEAAVKIGNPLFLRNNENEEKALKRVMHEIIKLSQ